MNVMALRAAPDGGHSPPRTDRSAPRPSRPRDRLPRHAPDSVLSASGPTARVSSLDSLGPRRNGEAERLEARRMHRRTFVAHSLALIAASPRVAFAQGRPIQPPRI